MKHPRMGRQLWAPCHACTTIGRRSGILAIMEPSMEPSGRARETINTSLRLPRDLRHQLLVIAEREHRSLHNLMLLYLRQGVERDRET